MTAYERLDLYQIDIIRRLVHEEFSKFIKPGAKDKEPVETSNQTRYPTVAILHEKIQACDEIPRWKIGTTKNVLSSMGFRFVLEN